jgi:hypothetical protein
MRGTVKAYSKDVNAGVIKCDTGKTYDFSRNEWHEDILPYANQIVEFQGSSRTASKIFLRK